MQLSFYATTEALMKKRGFLGGKFILYKVFDHTIKNQLLNDYSLSIKLLSLCM